MNDTCNASPAERRAQIDAAALAIAEAQAADYAAPYLDTSIDERARRWNEMTRRWMRAELAAAAWPLRWDVIGAPQG